jgi:hypothetical protein
MLAVNVLTAGHKDRYIENIILKNFSFENY